MEFQKPKLLFRKFEKQFLNFDLKSVEYSDTNYLKMLNILTVIILLLGKLEFYLVTVSQKNGISEN